MKVSVIIPAYNEAQTLPRLRDRLTAVLDGLREYRCEIVLVDDHSADATPALLEEWVQADARVRGLRFARNCGSHAALAAGLTHCRGDCAVLMAADLQDPPELIAELLTQWRSGQQVVWAARESRRGESLRTRLFSRLYWGLMRLVANHDVPPQGADVVLLDRVVIDTVNRIDERNTSLVSLLMWLGFRQTRISYVKQERAGGRSGWTFAKRLKLAIDSVVSFSSLPIRLTWLSGLLFLAGAASWLAACIGGRVTGAFAPPLLGAATIGLLLTGFGILLTFLGGVGEYVWRAYDEVRGRPRYVIERVYEQSSSRFVADPTAESPPAVPAARAIDTAVEVIS